MAAESGDDDKDDLSARGLEEVNRDETGEANEMNLVVTCHIVRL